MVVQGQARESRRLQLTVVGRGRRLMVQDGRDEERVVREAWAVPVLVEDLGRGRPEEPTAEVADVGRVLERGLDDEVALSDVFRRGAFNFKKIVVEEPSANINSVINLMIELW